MGCAIECCRLYSTMAGSSITSIYISFFDISFSSVLFSLVFSVLEFLLLFSFEVLHSSVVCPYLKHFATFGISGGKYSICCIFEVDYD